MKVNNINPHSLNIKGSHESKERNHGQHEERKFKPIVLAMSVAGTALPLILTRKKNEKFLKSLINFEHGLKSIIFVGTGSVLGGLLGGLIEDRDKIKKNPKCLDKKLQEGMYQIISNITVPTVFVWGGLKMAGKDSNKFLKAIISIVGVAGGMLAGRAITNEINGHLFPKSAIKRDIHLKDALIHIDDLPICLALSKENFLHIEKLVPLASIVSGYETGKRE